MRAALRKAIFAVPFGCLVAIATHFARFGDDHAFGGSANEALVSGAVGGAVAIALLILHSFLTSGTTTTTGTIAAARAGQLIPGARALFVIAATMYYGIESLEGNGLEIGPPTLVLAALATAVAYMLRRIAAIFAVLVAKLLCDWLALLDRRERLVWHLALNPCPLHSQVARAARRFGRAPPNEQRFPIFAVP